MNFLRKYFKNIKKAFKNFYKNYCNKETLNSPMAYLLYVAVGGLATVTIVRNYQGGARDYQGAREPKKFVYNDSLDARMTTTEHRLDGIEKNIKKIAQLNEAHRKAVIDNRIEREVNNQLKNVKAGSKMQRERKQKLAKLIDELVDEA